jgi:complement component 1 Q subcomponent-binding protein, mitochondrial
MEDLSENLKRYSYELVDKAGETRIQLVKTKGTVSIRIDVDCIPLPSEEDDGMFDEDHEGHDHEGAGHSHEEGDEEDEMADNSVEGFRLVITVNDSKKPTSVMQIGAFVTDHLRIQRVAMFAKGTEPTADQIFGGQEDTLPFYNGPNFEELDTTLQNAFYEHLEQLGIDDSFASALADYASAKEQSEYVQWLKSVEKFIK